MLYEIASVPSGQTERIAGILEGSRKLLAQIWNSGMDNMEIIHENRESGNTHIYLETSVPSIAYAGQLVKSETKQFFEARFQEKLRNS